MSRAVIFRPVASADIAVADDWWQENRPEARDGIKGVIARATGMIAEFPSIGVAVRSRVRGARRLVLDDTPFAIYYRLAASHIEVLRVWDGRRRGRPSL